MAMAIIVILLLIWSLGSAAIVFGLTVLMGGIVVADAYRGSSDGLSELRTFAISTDRVGPEIIRARLAENGPSQRLRLGDGPAPAREIQPGGEVPVDFTYVDGDGYTDRRFYSMPGTLKYRIECAELMDKAKLHKTLMAAAPDTVCKTYFVDKTSHLPPGLWMLRSNLGHVGSKSTPVETQRDFERIARKYAGKRDVLMISEYISRPMLYGGHKFHLRLYVIVGVFDSGARKAWLVTHGDLVPAKAAFVLGYWENKDIHDSHKKGNPDVVIFPDRVDDSLLSGTLSARDLQKAAAGVLRDALPHILPKLYNYPEAQSGYEMFGADIMFWDDGRPKIIEVNATPDLTYLNEAGTREYKSYIFDGILETVVPEVFSGWPKCDGDTPNTIFLCETTT